MRKKQFLRIHSKMKPTNLSVYSTEGMTTQRGNSSVTKTAIWLHGNTPRAKRTAKSFKLFSLIKLLVTILILML